MKTPMLLEMDQDWDQHRPIALEPTRWGKIFIQDHNFLDQQPLVKKYLENNNYVGGYYNQTVVQKLLKDEKRVLSHEDNQLITLAHQIETTAQPTSYILHSLLFDEKTYIKVEKHVHQRLITSSLGPSKSFSQPLLDHVINDARGRMLTRLNILDPCSGAGVLGYLMLETCPPDVEMHVINADLSPHAATNSDAIVSKTYPQFYQKYREKMQFIKQDAILMDKVPNSSFDYIVSFRALHEFSSASALKLIRSAKEKLKPKGKFIVLDVTREISICNQAEKLLPLLGQFSAFSVLMAEYFQFNQANKHFMDLVLEGDPIFSQAGVNSYKSGFFKEELESLCMAAGFYQVESQYIQSLPVGALFLVATQE